MKIKMKKKGSILLYGLALMLMILTLAAIFINIIMTWETVNRVGDAVDEGARVRAQAVDMTLKEENGYIEMFRPSSGYFGVGNGYFPLHNSLDTNMYVTPTGQKKILLPNDTTYVYKEQMADYATKNTIISMLNASLTTNTVGKNILDNFSENNICIQIKPLPETTATDVTFSCTTPNGETISAKAKVSSIKDNTYILEDPDGTPNSGDEKKVSVLNVAFVGVSFQHRYLLEDVFSMIGVSTVGKKQYWAIAYPQVDGCFIGATQCNAF